MTCKMLVVLALVVVALVVVSATDTKTSCMTVDDADRVAFCVDATHPDKYIVPEQNAAGEWKNAAGKPTWAHPLEVFAFCKGETCDATVLEDQFSCCKTTKACFGEGSESEENFAGSLVTIAIVGTVICAIPSIVLGALPACCGKMVEKKNMLGLIGMLLGLLAILSPIIGASTATATACGAACEDGQDCGPCSKEMEEFCKGGLAVLGIIFAVVKGIPAIILGIVGMSISGAALCGCCKAKAEMGAAPAAVVTAQKA